MSWVKAIVLAAWVAYRHLRAEPARAPLLGLRALPVPARRGVRRMLLRAGSLPRAYGLWDAGRHDEALDVVTAAARRGRPARLRRLAAFALAAGRPDVAGELITALPAGDTGRRRLDALLAVEAGEPLTALRSLGDGQLPAASNRLRRDLTGRMDVLTRTPGPGSAPGTGTGTPAGGVPGRVLHIVTNALPTTNAGYTVRTHKIALAQRRAGLDPHVVTRLGFPVAQGSLDARPRVAVEGVPYHRLVPWRQPATADVLLDRNVEAASRLVERLRPSVLHAASNHVNAQVALALRERYGLPVVYEVRGFLEESWLSRDPRRSAGSDFYRLSRELETSCMRAADLVVTLGTVMRDEIVARGVREERIVIVPNAVDEELLLPLPDAAPLKAALGIAPDERVVGTTTSFYGYEGLDTLLEAGAELRRRGVPVRLLLVGDGPERAALERHAADLGLGEVAIFPGRVPPTEVRRYHAVLDVFAVPRRDERVCRLVTPLKPVEAMAAGLPVVASDLEPMREIVQPGITGQLTFPGDPHVLAEALEKMLYSPNAHHFGQTARSWIERERTWRVGAEALRAAYGDLGRP
ncbi:glycosyltransferase family 4 protein [Actinomadura sp. HBU206391]|uniref:glycosyltransferase family 4 protein n=1 Tax=Actinomadura sp. HBU206391 TaxID=2731692 RepID=UPI00164F5AB6|nr:glycosyltransferase family 4 protein [Actinomadura sp. HBU206391]MBC6460901.1 glycosyltransferase [Actinomadura sp. HBU206391]